MPKGIPKNPKPKPVKAVMTTQEYIESLDREVANLHGWLKNHDQEIAYARKLIEEQRQQLKSQRKLLKEIAGYQHVIKQLPSIDEIMNDSRTATVLEKRLDALEAQLSHRVIAQNDFNAQVAASVNRIDPKERPGMDGPSASVETQKVLAETVLGSNRAATEPEWEKGYEQAMKDVYERLFSGKPS